MLNLGRLEKLMVFDSTAECGKNELVLEEKCPLLRSKVFETVSESLTYIYLEAFFEKTSTFTNHILFKSGSLTDMLYLCNLF